ncbi:MAG: hypothetical protein JWO48_158 [Bryobacterales bacterium]|nr:hypothetical protein [Bryobacterales bacterium]
MLLPFALPLRDPCDFLLLRSARYSGGPLWFWRGFLARRALQFLSFESVGNVFCMHQVFFSPAYFSTSFFSP